MKFLSSILAAATLGASSMFATVIQLPGAGQDLPKNGTGAGGGNGANADDNFARLLTAISQSPSPGSYPTPTATGSANITSNNVTNLLGFEYAVLHYGVGPNGNQGTGGGIAIYYITGGETSWTFPLNGLGPNGTGGFSGGTLFNSNAVPGNAPGPNVPGVPDGGTTAALLGSALIGLFLVRRRVTK